MRLILKKAARYAIAAALIAFSYAAYRYLSWLVASELPTYITFYPCVTLVAVYLGLGPGILATGLSVAITAYSIYAPSDSFAVSSLRQALSLVLFSVIGLCISGLAESRRRFEAKLVKQQGELESLVARRTSELTCKNTELADEIVRHRRTERELVRLNEHLEQRIQERTAELAEHVARLKEEAEERRLAEQALQASEERYRTVVEDQTELIARTCPDGRISFVNEVYCRFFGVSEAEVLGTQWQPQVFPEDHPQLEERLGLLSADNPVVVVENRVRSASGELHWLQAVHRGTFDPQGNLVEIQVVARDICDRKGYEDRLKRYAQRLIALEEELRKEIAAELHDDVGQELTVLSLNLGHLSKHLPADAGGRLQPTLDESRKLVRTIHNTVRNLMVNLRPVRLEEDGLVPVLRSYTELYRKRTGIEVLFQAAPDFPRLGPTREISLFRIAQEALHNVLKHADASRASVLLDYTGSTARLTITDDGKGMVLPAPLPESAGSGWGLTIMRERAELIGGRFRVHSEPGATSLSVELSGC